MTISRTTSEPVPVHVREMGAQARRTFDEGQESPSSDWTISLCSRRSWLALGCFWALCLVAVAAEPPYLTNSGPLRHPPVPIEPFEDHDPTTVRHPHSSTGYLGGTAEPGDLIEGFTSPYRSVDVAAPEVGTIEDILIKQGQLVKKGDVLAVLDREVLVASLEMAKAKACGYAKRDAARIELELKQKRLDNLTRLGKSLTSPEELDRAKADVELVRTQVTSAEQELLLESLDQTRIQAQLDRRTIRSPLDGIVVRLYHEIGEFVPQSDPKIATVVDLSRLRIVFHPPTHVAEQLNPQDKLPVRLLPTDSIVATQLEFISPLTNADSGSVRLEVILDNAAGQYRSGVRCALIGDGRLSGREPAANRR